MSITAKKLQKPLIVNGQNILPLTSMDQVLTDDEGSRLNETIHQNLAPIELTSTATRAYAVGEFLVYDNLLYRVTQAIALGGTITPGTNCVTDKVGDEIKTLKDALSNIDWYRLSIATGVQVTTTQTTQNTLNARAFSDYDVIIAYVLDSAKSYLRASLILPIEIFKSVPLSISWVNSANQQNWVEVYYDAETAFRTQANSNANGSYLNLIGIKL